MFTIASNDLGQITVSRETVETIAGLAAVDCYGLVGMAPRRISSGIAEILGLESLRKGVEVTETPAGLAIDVYVVVGYGTKISEVALNVMQKIRYVMEEIAGLRVATVNVNVQSVRVSKP
ncbi:MAG: Asp23/Gls24 family envelope stress response protein [Syntrophomonadaceae bacterium]|nr:Asp23/Gls24 family envelope stress response protein [Syntrophomonadaceae bacterium]MDH7497387.1 Asp23/Gls24 family envelope stress response protein [Syntrophomonadaceae bacterium]